jgi:hypothetical protein
MWLFCEAVGEMLSSSVLLSLRQGLQVITFMDLSVEGCRCGFELLLYCSCSASYWRTRCALSQDFVRAAAMAAYRWHALRGPRFNRRHHSLAEFVFSNQFIIFFSLQNIFPSSPHLHQLKALIQEKAPSTQTCPAASSESSL